MNSSLSSFASALALSLVCIPLAQAQEACEGPDCASAPALERKAAAKEELYSFEPKPEKQPVEAIPFTQGYEPSPAIWRLSDEDTTIYMFGTFHLLPEGFRWRSEAFDAIVAEADELVLETSDAEAESEIAELVPEMFASMFSREPVTARLSEEAAEKYLLIAEQAGMPGPIFDRMPIILALMGAGLSLSEAQGSSYNHGVETILEAEFAEAGKPIGSIESSKDVMRALLAIDEGKMIPELESALLEWDGESIESLAFGGVADTDDASERDPFASEHAWAKGELIIEDNAGFGEGPASDALYQALLVDRNKAWADWLKARLDQPGTVLLAVGGAHFEGEDSVQRMLERIGLSSERIH